MPVDPEKRRAACRRHRQKDPEAFRAKQRAWYAANQEKWANYRKTKKDKNPQASAIYSKTYRERHPEKQKAAEAAWRQRNRDYVNAKARERMANDPSFRISKRLRSRVLYAIREQGTKKLSKTAVLIGCDIPFLMGYLEAKFTRKMKWSNYGSVWEIDHIIPCSSYDLTDEYHQRSCFHYTNLQPLLIADNRRKHDKIPENVQPELPCPSNCFIGS